MATAPDKTAHVAFWGQGHSGVKDIVEFSRVATVTLYPQDSNQTYLFDSAAGIVYTLPKPSVGLRFKFVTTVTITSNAAKVITNSASVFLNGLMTTVATDSSNALAAWVGNGSSHISVSMNGTTTGGVVGGQFNIVCVSSTLWTVDGWTPATSTVATPFSAT